MSDKLRADIALVKQGLVKSRESARAYIMAGQVFHNEEKVTKASYLIDKEDRLSVKQAPHPYVSRGGLKLEKALQEFHGEVNGCVALDIGAATGGFTDVLLRRGARHVYAIDVGYGQLDWTLRNHPQVTVMERTNARTLTKEHFTLLPNITVMDVSFISIKLILPVAMEIMGEEGIFYTLIKPQFEAGRGNVGKKGVVREKEIHQQVLYEIAAFCEDKQWAMTALTFSPIKGPSGNIEFLAKIQKTGAKKISTQQIDTVVEQAHKKLFD